MKFRHLITVNFLAFISMVAVAQAPAIEWEISYGGSKIEEVEKIILTRDGGYAMVGMTHSSDGDIDRLVGDVGCWVIKVDRVGNIMWTRVIGTSDYADGLDIAETKDEGFIVVGHTNSTGGDFLTQYSGEHDAFMAKLDKDGNIEWANLYGGASYDVLLSVVETEDGYVAAGYRGSDVAFIGYGDYDAWILKTDFSGNIVWEKPIGGTRRESAQAIKKTEDGGYIFTGRTTSGDGHITDWKGLGDLLVCKLDAEGNIQWLKTFGGSGEDWGFDVEVASDGYLIAGYTSSSNGDISINQGNNDVWILKLDFGGNLIWEKTYGGTGYDDAQSIKATADGGFIVGGRTTSSDGDVSFNNGNNDYWILKLDGDGNVEWEKTLGGSQQDLGKYVIPAHNGGYLVAGDTYSSDGDVSVNKGQTDIWMVKLGDCTLDFPNKPHPIGGIADPCTGAVYVYNLPVVDKDIEGYTWNVPIGWKILHGQGGSAITVQAGNGAGIVSVKAYNNCKSSEAQTFPVTPVINVAPAAMISSDVTSICKNAPVEFMAEPIADALEYKWKKNGLHVGTNATSYVETNILNGDVVECEVILSNTCGISSITSNPVVIEVLEPFLPSISIETPRTEICKGENARFVANIVNGGTNPQLLWYINEVSTGFSGDVFNVSTLKDDDIVSCWLTSDQHCVTATTSASNKLLMSVVENNTKVKISAAKTVLCEKEEANFIAEVFPDRENVTYNWRVNGVEAGNYSNSFAKILTNQDKVECTVFVNESLCNNKISTSNEIEVTVHPLPIITIYPNDTIVAMGEQVSLITQIDNDVEFYNWTPEDLLINTSLNATTIAITSPVQIKLNVTSLAGCNSSATVDIKPLLSLYVPNAFTPNNDGKNDIFRIPPNTDFNLTEFRVYNRWGQLVFTTKNINEGWNGRLNGLDCPPGLYVYHISGFRQNEQVELKGSVTLLR